MNFTNRTSETELMDQPGVGKTRLKEVYRDLDRVNNMLGGNRITINAVSNMLKNQAPGPYTIVDVGCGDGSMLRALARFGRRQNIEFNLIGIDLSQNALDIAEELSESYSEISFLKKNILSDDQDTMACDVMICTLTLHHIKEEEMPLFLEKMVDIASIGVVINDLQRSRWAYYLFKVFSVIFIKTKIAKNDGLVSIRRGFAMKELQHLSSYLPSVSHSIKRKWAFRYAWAMYKSANTV
ncbi:methyltransferase domain-containing protein [Muriicola sp. Z0-33]|uniref:methyltransferase domain-containing protein n=1 Tax=Muriicola sp. Z0-33 TaxID=2816957 RepID=UPI002238A3E0|nr:methyltransferase domain-containing protein [Muriicola sp. Z0-33]MCW5515316.1 methyltransferase domain-containing protein [Muriicola sp. Z0-33]